MSSWPLAAPLPRALGSTWSSLLCGMGDEPTAPQPLRLDFECRLECIRIPTSTPVLGTLPSTNAIVWAGFCSVGFGAFVVELSPAYHASFISLRRRLRGLFRFPNISSSSSSATSDADVGPPGKAAKDRQEGQGRKATTGGICGRPMPKARLTRQGGMRVLRCCTRRN